MLKTKKPCREELLAALERDLRKLDELDLKQKTILTNREKKINTIYLKAEEEAADIQREYGKIYDALERQCVKYRGEIFGEEKSLKLENGTVKFHQSQALGSRKDLTWAEVKELVKERHPEFIRIKEEIDKDGLKRADADTQETCGVHTVTMETFNVTAKSGRKLDKPSDRYTS